MIHVVRTAGRLDMALIELATKNIFVFTWVVEHTNTYLGKSKIIEFLNGLNLEYLYRIAIGNKSGQLTGKSYSIHDIVVKKGVGLWKGLFLTPNPFNNFFKVKGVENDLIELYDLFGRKIECKINDDIFNTSAFLCKYSIAHVYVYPLVDVTVIYRLILRCPKMLAISIWVIGLSTIRMRSLTEETLG